MPRTFCIILSVLLLTFVDVRADAKPAVDTQDPQQLIAALADPDSAVRHRAAQRLAQLGPAVRPQLIKASRGGDPEQRAQAARILATLPWTSETDPPDARALMERYGPADDMTRASIIGRLYELRAAPTLLRLLNEEPSDFVRWVVVWALGDLRDAESQAAMRQLEPAENDAQALHIAGRAWIERDPKKALKYFRSAIEAEAARPSNDIGMLDLAYQHLVGAAVEAEDFEAAAALLRRQVPRELVPRRTFRRSRRQNTHSLPRLLALHDYFGPLKGFGWDCQTFGIQTTKPPLLQVMTARLSWLGFAPPAPMGLTSNLPVVERYAAGAFLLAAELTPAADLELDAAARLLDPNNDRRALIVRPSESGQEDVQDMLCELHWRRARDAHAAGDVAAANREIQRFIDLNPGNSDAAIRIINWLKETDRRDHAASFFERIYKSGRQNIEQATIKAGWRNDLAWLCARTGERLDEAVEMAQQAVNEMPDTAAFLDTLAEAKYRTGKREEAIALESRALELSPDSRFMKEQLERFKAGRP